VRLIDEHAVARCGELRASSGRKKSTGRRWRTDAIARPLEVEALADEDPVANEDEVA
jgi:hypothetical protein